MSLGGMLGAALGGGANAAGEIARGNIQRQGQLDLARETALIEEERAKRVREANFKFENDPATLATRAASAATLARAASKTERELKLERLNDGDLTAAEARKAELDAADATRRKVAEAEAMSDIKVRESGLIAQAQARAQAANKPREKTLAERAAEIEAFTGVKLTPEDRKALAGLKTGKESGTDAAAVKFAEGLVQEAVKAGEISVDDAPAKRNALIGALTGRTQQQDALIRSAVEQARRDGKLGEVAAELRQRGFTDAQIATYIPAADLKTESGLRRKQPDPIMVQMSESTLRNIAGDRSHPRRSDAQAELTRRRQSGSADESGTDLPSQVYRID